MKRRMLQAAATLAIAYAGACALARASYRRFVYPAPSPQTRACAPDGPERLELRASDGAATHALWLAPASPGARVVAYFHGNGATADDELELASWIRARGLGALVVEYRGYGASSTSPAPSEAGLYADAEAALDEIARRGFPPERVALWGISLGTGVAAEMARRGRAAALVLVSPFTSLQAVAARVWWAGWLPTSLLVPDRYDTLSKAASLRVPTLIVHGDRDGVVPFDMGRTLSTAIAGARFVAVVGADHNDVYALGGDALMEAILAHCRTGGPS
jgi:uncharacterized protein